MKSIDESFFQLLWNIPNPIFGFNMGFFVKELINLLNDSVNPKNMSYEFESNMKRHLYDIDLSDTRSRGQRNKLYDAIQKDKLSAYKNYEDISALYDVSYIYPKLFESNKQYLQIGVNYSIGNLTVCKHVSEFRISDINLQFMNRLCSTYDSFQNYQDMLKLLKI